MPRPSFYPAILSLLLRAAASPNGLVIATDDTKALAQRFYRVRALALEEGIEEVRCLAFRTSPINPTAEVWITHQGDTNAEGG